MQVNERVRTTRLTLTDLMRAWFRFVLDPIGGFLNRLGLMPNTVTLLGLAGTLVASILLARGNFLVGGILVLVMGLIDALDGTMARLRGEATEFGAFVDSVTDRYVELLIMGGLLVYFLRQGDVLTATLVFAAAAGSVLVSYVKARAEGLHFEAKLGILTRMERYLVVVPSLILGYPKVGLWIIAILANLTALQRILHVRRQARSGKGNP
jgi:CDP-diacylglycerol--glycerol-3-phosphate 3-phosphatidyltransferase